MASSAFSVGVDIGGTFTDLVGFGMETGEIVVTKARSTPRDLTQGIMGCVEKSGIPLASVETLFHGSTVVINAMIEKKGAKTALVTTRGFRDILEIGRGNRPENYNLFYTKPVPVVPRHLRFEVSERIAPDGSVVTPLDSADLKRIANEAKRHNVEAIAICFLHGYANEAHEEQALAYLRDALPGIYVTASAEVSREWREFERSSTVAMNAFVGPTVENYLTKLETDTAAAGFDGRFYLMQSSGGVMTAARAKRYPVAMVESGPVAGMIGAAHIGTLIGERLVIGFDMGGTTAKASLIEDGVPKVAPIYYVDGYAHGYPLQVPTIEVIEVGTGGGSLAWIDDLGAAKVGPRSAGSEPGPVCVGAGGVEPTVTDANVVLGRVNAEHYLGGEMSLDVEAARNAIADRVGKPLGLDTDRAAAGILTIANANMALAVRGITIEKGVDPRNAAMVAFGGGGPLHAAAIARDIGIGRIIVPTYPSCFSALGMLLSDVRHDLVRTHVAPFPCPDYDEINEVINALRTEGIGLLRAAGLAEDAMRCDAYLDLRYRGQQWTLTVPVGADHLTDEAAPDIRQAFNALYEVRFGHSFTTIPTELVNVRVIATGLRRKPDFTIVERREGAMPKPGTRKVYFGDGFVDTAIWRREDLRQGDKIDGPAIIEEDHSTTVVAPGDTAEVIEYGFLALSIGGR